MYPENSAPTTAPKLFRALKPPSTPPLFSGPMLEKKTTLTVEFQVAQLNPLKAFHTRAATNRLDPLRNRASKVVSAKRTALLTIEAASMRPTPILAVTWLIEK